MNQLIKILKIDNINYVSSKEVAEKFNRNHFDVLKAYRTLETDLQDPDFIERNFASKYISKLDGSIETSEILMTKDGFSLLALGFTGKFALQWKVKFISAFNDLEKHIFTLQEKNEALLEENKRLVAKLLPKQKQEKTILVPQFQRNLFGDMQITKYIKEPQKQLSNSTLIESKVLHLSKQIEGMSRKINELQQSLALERRR